MKFNNWINRLIIAVLFVISSACTTSVIVKQNPKFASDTNKNFATVYMIRPTPIRTRGIADNDVHIEFDDVLATSLSAGEYVALKLKPGSTNLIIRSQTYLTSKPMPVDVKRSRLFEFEAGKQYFILAKFDQEEFRGIYFVPVEISLAEAKSMLNRLKPAGQLAKSQPLDSL